MRNALRLLSLASLALAVPAFADGFNLAGFGARAAAMGGGAMTADARDSSAAYYNPAMLVLRKDFHFLASGLVLGANTTVTSTDESKNLDCRWCKSPTHSGFQVGLLFPLAGKVQNRVAIGLGAYLPSGQMVRDLTPDSEQPYFYNWLVHPQRMQIFIATGIRITNELTVGAGVQVLANLEGPGATIGLDLFSKRFVVRSLDSGLKPTAFPTAGVFFSPERSLRFGASYRGELRHRYSIPALIDLEGVGALNMVIAGTNHFQPHQLNLGASWDPSPEVTLSTDLTYSLWSLAPTPYMELSVDLDGDTLRALGLDTALDLNSPVQNPGFKDTLSGRIGVEYKATEQFRIRGGGFYKPTHVPKQDTEGTNLLDGNTLGFTAGAGVSFADPLELFSQPLTVDVAGQYALIMGREAKKDATDDTASYTYGGSAFGAMVTLRYRFGAEDEKRGAPVEEKESSESEEAEASDESSGESDAERQAREEEEERARARDAMKRREQEKKRRPTENDGWR